MTQLIREKDLITTARLLSAIFTPFAMPLVGLLALFLFSYLGMLPWLYKAEVLLLVAFFTIMLPVVLIRLYRHWRGWSFAQIASKERRVVPYIISILCYFLCCHVMRLLHIPHLMSSILLSALMIQVLCSLTNVWWKISTHTAGVGGIAGAVVAFARIFMFNPVWWLCLIIIVAGMMGTARLILRQHTLAQVVCGFLLGGVVAYATVTML